jgi:hypothetical protein
MTIEFKPEGETIDVRESKYGAVEDDIYRVFEHFECDGADVMSILTNMLCIVALNEQLQKSVLIHALTDVYDFHDSCMTEQTLQ